MLLVLARAAMVASDVVSQGPGVSRLKFDCLTINQIAKDSEAAEGIIALTLSKR